MMIKRFGADELTCWRRALPIVGLAVTAFQLAPSAASAQSQPNPVTSRDDLDPIKPQQSTERPRVRVEGDIERAPCALEDPAYDKIRIIVTSAEFNNLGPVPPSELEDSYRDLIGKDQPISVVCQIRDAAATALRSMGYLAAIQVPTQRIEGGAVKFEVLYAKVTSIRVVGQPGANERLVEAYLQNLANGQLFNRFKAERYILLARDIPGYDVRLALKPAGTGPGEMVGEVTLRNTKFSMDASVQNFAAPSAGRYAGQVRATLNGLTGMGDRTTISLYSSAQVSEQQIFQFGHDLAIGKSGLRIGGRFTYAWTRPDLGPLVPAVNARTLYANLEAGYPLVRRQAFSARAALGFDYVNQLVNFGGAPLSSDHVRVGYARLDVDGVDLKGVGPGGTSGWRANGSIELRKGLSLFGASPNCVTNLIACVAPGVAPPSLPDGNPTATIVRISGSVDLRLIKGVQFTFAPRAQFGSSPLFAFEQMSGGNYTIGRGFDPGAATGDRGYGFQFEAATNSLRPFPKSRIDVQPYGFTDQAWITNKNSLTPNPQRLSSAGVGARIGFAGRVRLDVAAAFPLNRLSGETSRRPTRFLMSLTTNILPWRTQ